MAILFTGLDVDIDIVSPYQQTAKTLLSWCEVTWRPNLMTDWASKAS